MFKILHFSRTKSILISVKRVLVILRRRIHPYYYLRNIFECSPVFVGSLLCRFRHTLDCVDFPYIGFVLWNMYFLQSDVSDVAGFVFITNLHFFYAISIRATSQFIPQRCKVSIRYSQFDVIAFAESTYLLCFSIVSTLTSGVSGRQSFVLQLYISLTLSVVNVYLSSGFGLLGHHLNGCQISDCYAVVLLKFAFERRSYLCL